MNDKSIIREVSNTDPQDRENVYRMTVDILKKNGIKFKCSKSEVDDFINCRTPDGEYKPDQTLFFSLGREVGRGYDLVIKKIKPYGGSLHIDNYGSMWLSLKESADDLELPTEVTEEIPDIYTLLDNTDPKHIYLSSDWHFFKNHYKREANYVNTQKIVTWCRQNFKPDDVFMFLGDISFRYANDVDKKKSQEILKSIPGIKVLVLGNHDRMAGDEYYTGCGFTYVFEEITWKNLVFTHRPINMSLYPDNYWNIHGHIHNIVQYNTTDGKRNINVYPMYYDNKPVTLDYLLNHKEELVKDHEWNNNAMLGESDLYYVPARGAGKTSKLTKLCEAVLKASQYGIPEDKKFPLETRQHVKSAIKLFGHAEESKKKELAKRIARAAKKYDISIPETTQCYKYLTESVETMIPSEVDTIVFDMGSVLVDAHTKETLLACPEIPDRYVDEIYDIITRKFFYEKEEPAISNYSIDEAKAYFRKVSPDYIAELTDQIFDLFLPAMYQYDYTDELLRTFRTKGYKLYYLSNWDKYSYDLEESFFKPLLEKFDGGIFSFEFVCEKPDTEIYYKLINKYGLVPHKCLFFDDKVENINAAVTVGMHGIVFNHEETPKMLLGPLDINENTSHSILGYDENGITSIDESDISWWYICNNRKASCVDEEHYYKTLPDAIKAYTTEKDFQNHEAVEKYVFTCNGDRNCEDALNMICLGQITIYENLSYEWIVQYPIKLINGKITAVMKEWSMASCNPIKGILKPYVIQASGYKYNNTIPTTQYMLSPDLISDKYLVINEFSKLEVVPADSLDDFYVEVYEYVGPMAFLSKIEEAYCAQKTVDNTFFYTSLTGKPMLSSDQIEFDENFRKVDFDLIRQKSISELATLRDNLLESIGYRISRNKLESAYAIEEPSFVKKYKSKGFSIREDFDGFYFYNETNKKRSASVGSTSQLTENMIKSIF